MGPGTERERPPDPAGPSAPRALRRRGWHATPRRSAPIAVAVLVVLLASAFSVSGSSTTSAAKSVLQEFDSHISHIVFVMLENHAYDSYFGVYCPTVTKYCPSAAAGIPPGTCVPYYPSSPSQGCIRPYNFTKAQLAPPDMNHIWSSTHQAIDNGAMNGFFEAEGDSPETFGHYNGSTVPVYWDLAEEYGLGDMFFSSAASYSLPNHWFAVSANAPNVSELDFPGASSVAVQHTYLNQSNASATIEDQLVNTTNVSWTYFDWALPSYTTAITDSGGGGQAYDLWNPLAARAQSYAASAASHFQSSAQFDRDAINGTLPNLSWVIPPIIDSDHPPMNITNGQSWVASLVDSVEASPEWNSTVIFVTWDEYGGFYDNVVPPSLDAVGDGLRVPLLAIGPWVRQDYIDTTSMDFGSILHLMELRFGLACAGLRDCNASLPLGMFNFNRLPRAPILIPTYANASYPMRLQSSGRLPPFDPEEVPPAPYANEQGVPPGTEFAEGGLG